MGRLTACAVSVGVLATLYVAACMLPGEPSGAERIQFTLDSAAPYRLPLAGVVEPLIAISADGHVLTNPSYRLETLDAGVVRVDSTGRRLLGVMRGTAAVRVTYLGATGTPDTVFPVRVVISRVAVDSPALAFTRLEARTRLSAIALDANDATVPNVPITWSSADPTVAVVNDSGLVMAVNEGTTTIAAEADGVADSAEVTVTQVAAAVRVVPELDTLRTVGRSIQLRAVATDSIGEVLWNARPGWTSSDSTVARVDATGRATATGAGTARIIARVGEAADTATLVVAQVILIFIVTPGYDTLTAIADTGRLVALAFDSLNFSISNLSVGWTTSDAAVATVDQAGLVRAERNGVALVTASAAGQGGSATVLVRQEVATVRLAEDSVALTGKGDTVRLNAAGLDKNGHLVDAAAFSWRSSSAIVARVDASGLVTAQYSGRTSIISTSGSTSGAARPDTATVTVTGAPGTDLIAFMRRVDGYHGDIYVVNLDGSGVTQLTSGADNDVAPAWLPDDRIAFFRGGSPGGSPSGPYMMNADGSGITRDPRYDRLPAVGGAWSPDGSKIAFVGSGGQVDERSIFVVNADGSGLTRLTYGAIDVGPAWSPDGGSIAFHRSLLANENMPVQIYVMNADGSNVHRLTSTGSTQSAECGGVWSPDGSRIVLWTAVSYAPFTWGIVTINSDGSGSPEIAFAEDPGDNYPTVSCQSTFDWSPDGRMIVFSRFALDFSQVDLWLVGTDGSGLRQLTTGGGSQPAWRRGSRE